jgi:hypothetical protein
VITTPSAGRARETGGGRRKERYQYMVRVGRKDKNGGVDVRCAIGNNRKLNGQQLKAHSAR